MPLKRKHLEESLNVKTAKDQFNQKENVFCFKRYRDFPKTLKAYGRNKISPKMFIKMVNYPLDEKQQLASTNSLTANVIPVTRILARLTRCMGMLAKILARSCQDLTKATMIMQDHGKADHASYQAYQDFPCILPSFSMCLAKHTKIFLSILPIQPGFFHAFCKAFQDFRCNLQSLIRSTCVFEPFEILY